MAEAAPEKQEVLRHVGERREDSDPCSAIITYCLVAIVHHDMKLPPLYEILQILGISLTDKTPLQELLTAKNPEKKEKVEDESLDLFDNLYLC